MWWGSPNLDPLSVLPKLSDTDKAEYLGKRLGRVGGAACPGSDDSADDDADEDPAQGAGDTAPEEAAGGGGDDPELVPIAWHCLPVTLVLDFVKALNVKHVLDFSPTPLPLQLLRSRKTPSRRAAKARGTSIVVTSCCSYVPRPRHCSGSPMPPMLMLKSSKMESRVATAAGIGTSYTDEMRVATW